MAEGRMIKKRVAMSKKLAAVNDSAGFLYFMMYPHADFAGRIEADPMIIKGQMLTYSNWDVEKIQACLENLYEVGLIVLYKSKGNQYLQFTRFEDFQRLDPKKEAETKIPSPPALLRSTLENSGISKVKISKVKISKDQPTAALKAELDKIYKKGFNIFAIINRAKKELKQPKEWQFPEEVLMKICHSYWQNNGKIKKPWPWFVRVLKQCTCEYNANKNIQNHEAVKKEGVPQALKDIIRGL